MIDVIALALSDAINPCTLVIQTLLLSNLLTKGKKEAFIGGILFTITIYFTYFLYGVLLRYLILKIYFIIEFLLIFLLIIMILSQFYSFFNYKPGFISMEMPLFLRKYCRKILEYGNNPLITIPIAILVSLFLLPCSSGPYLVFLSLYGISPIIFLYLAIFVSPMILITILVSFGFSTEKILEWRNRNIRKIHLINGILLLIVLIYVLLSIK